MFYKTHCKTHTLSYALSIQTRSLSYTQETVVVCLIFFYSFIFKPECKSKISLTGSVNAKREDISSLNLRPSVVSI